MAKYLAVFVAIKKDVPGRQVSMDKAFSGEVLHALCSLATELQQQRWCVVINSASKEVVMVEMRYTDIKCMEIHFDKSLAIDESYQ